ncbi:MAG: TIGR00730 family Rossman fold protein [Alphaproteobacteria bacterium]|nr:TIGR00730 family Rossman fold protein [Hyphomonas sp.]MBR9807496.1 TIGR00730 family Rossman fold protein [Alphaproteobacteria bacterium]|tara:strand:- start:2116 stop:2679 length:564 start_codon:yes stop_codon:yes gene_type:complete
MSKIKSVCVYCGASDAVQPGYLRLAEELGRELAEHDLRLVYGGGGVGLMGACARAAHESAGDVLGIMPRFLLDKEMIYDEVEHRIVENMHIRKQMMFDESDAFIVLPGGIGTLEEAVEILSWARLGLHAKPMAFLDEDGFWSPFFELMDHIIDGKFTPENFRTSLVHCDTPKEAIDALLQRHIVLGE